MHPLLLSTMIWIIVIQLFVLAHYLIIEKWKKTPWHAVSFLLAATIAYLITGQIYTERTFRVISMIYLGLMYWILFSLELNKFRGKPWLHLGDKSILDRIEKSMKSPAMTLGLKITLMLMCLFVLLDL